MCYYKLVKYKRGNENMFILFAIVWLFFASINAWSKGDDSMSWFVVLIIILFIIGSIGALVMD